MDDVNDEKKESVRDRFVAFKVAQQDALAHVQPLGERTDPSGLRHSRHQHFTLWHVPSLWSLCAELPVTKAFLPHPAQSALVTRYGACNQALGAEFKQQRVRVRLKEIDRRNASNLSGTSQQSLTALCANKVARVTWTEKDRNGRLLARVWCSGIDANAEQVRRRMAWVFDRYVKDRSLYSLQHRARAAQLGLWADAQPMPPWEWRARRGELEYRARK